MENDFRMQQIKLGYSAVLRSAMNADDREFVREELGRNQEFVKAFMASDVRTLYEDARRWLGDRASAISQAGTV